MNYESIPEWQKKEIKEVLDTYSFLGTRDSESEKFLKSIGCVIPPVHTCDPTAFLNVNDLPVDVNLLNKKLIERGFDKARKTIGIMGNESMCRMIRRMFGDQFQLVSLYNYNSLCDINLNDLSPFEWAYVFRFFNVTVTTFFHGTMLSLRNGVPVLCIALETDYAKRHITKVADVLHRLDLDNLYWTTDFDRLNFNEIRQEILNLIQTDMYEVLIDKMNKEALSVNSFLAAIKN
jgi:polysaccharide pyruvyl transferase WcaK-like protein